MSLIDRFNSIIESNFNNQDFGIDDACRELGTSRSQLFRHIKEQTGLSTSLYIRKRRLTKARELLKSSNMKTSEIAYHVGIDSPQNFSKYFHQEFGITPSAFRKEAPEEPQPPAEVTEIPKTKKATRPASYLYLSAGLALLITLSAYVFLSGADEQTNSIAIMPFKNLGLPQTAYYCDGIAEQIHGSLDLDDELKVISNTSSGKYRQSPKSIREIANELDVNYILEGSVFQENNNIRITVGLVRVKDDSRVWSKNYDGNAEDVFQYLSNVSTEVARELGQKLSKDEKRRVARIPTKNPAAYKEFLQGQQLIVSREKEHLEESVIRLSNAIRLDPEFADAYAMLALALLLQGESAFIDTPTSHRLSEQNALTAIRIDTENSLAYATLGNIYRAQNKWEQARTTFEIALKFNSNDAMINYWYSLLLRGIGDLPEAIKYSSKALELDPLSHVSYAGHIVNCVYGGELAMAKTAVEEGRVLFSDSYTFNWAAGVYYAKLKNYDEAIQLLTRTIELNPTIRVPRYARAYYHGLAGHQDEVNAFLAELPDLPVYYISRSVAYAGLGDREQSIAFLQKAADAGILATDIKVAPYFTLHHNDPRFEVILEKFGLASHPSAANPKKHAFGQ